MRVAVVEPFFRTSGVTTYAMHLAEGFRRAGCDVSVVSFMKDKARKVRSGQSAVQNGRVQSGWQWSPFFADETVRWGDAAEALKGFDLVFLNEPRCAPLDKEAMRKLGKGDIKAGRQMVADHDLAYSDLPPYVRALSESGTTWATCMHDPGYGPKLAPFLPQLMELAPPRVIMTHRPGSVESAYWAVEEAGTDAQSKMAVVQTPNLPYAYQGDVKNTASRTFGMTGRYINNKGQPTLVGLAAEGMMPGVWTVVIGGASPLGAGPNHTFLTFESLTSKHYSFEGAREGNGNVTTGDPWSVPGIARYDGPYDDGVEYSARAHAVHVNATEVGFSGAGSLEYSDLEAVDAGCLLVLPHHRNSARGLTHTRGLTHPGVDPADPGSHPPGGSPIRTDSGAYRAHEFELSKCLNAELSPITEERRSTLESLGAACAEAAASWEDPKLRRAEASFNFEAMIELSDPRKYAELVLSEAL